ncbi:myosin-2 heavy chain, non muscle-like isoform X3 [Bacillus rossius redtenbacheri]
MCQILDNFLRNLQDVEIQADSLRVHLLQVERELAQVEGERSRCEEEGAALAGSRELRLAEASHKEVQLELLQHKEAALNRLLAREREHLRTENSQAKQLQEKVFSARTEFCDQVWQFSEYITNQANKDDLAIKSDEKKVNEEITQLESKKSALEAELSGLNTRLDAVSKQVDKANIEMEELESFIMAKEFLE